jgi:hypothetical protein
MRLITLLLVAATNAIAQDVAAASSILSAAAASLTDLGSLPSITDLGSVPSITDLGSLPSVTLAASLSSLEAQGSCLTGSSYLNCVSGYTDGNICTQIDASSKVACVCSSASKYYGYVSRPNQGTQLHLDAHEIDISIIQMFFDLQHDRAGRRS